MPENIGSIFIEINLFKAKWLVYGCYHPPSQEDQYFFNNLGNALDKYTQNYEKFLLAGDFNAKAIEPCLSEFLYNQNAEKIVKKMCSKSLTKSLKVFRILLQILHGYKIFMK